MKIKYHEFLVSSELLNKLDEVVDKSIEEVVSFWADVKIGHEINKMSAVDKMLHLHMGSK